MGQTKSGNGGHRPSEDPTSIGNILLRHGMISAPHLEAAVQFQQEHADVLMGHALVELGHLSPAELQVACEEQRVIRELAKRKSAREVERCMEQATRASQRMALSLETFSSEMELRAREYEDEDDDRFRR
jgi:hypothetical protein